MLSCGSPHQPPSCPANPLWKCEKKKETNLINSSLELRASRTCNNFHLATFFFNIIYIFILFFRKIIWRWRRRSDLLCLGYVWAAPWTGCCHAASSHLDVVRAALRKSLRLRLRLQRSQVSVYVRVCVRVFHPRLRHRFGLHFCRFASFWFCALLFYI